MGSALWTIPVALVLSMQIFQPPNVAVMVLVTTIIGMLLLVPMAKHMKRVRLNLIIVDGKCLASILFQAMHLPCIHSSST
jgi:hypothetical protein